MHIVIKKKHAMDWAQGLLAIVGNGTCIGVGGGDGGGGGNTRVGDECDGVIDMH